MSVVVLTGAALAVFFPPITGPRTGVPASRKVSSLTYPAVVVSEFTQPVGDQWLLPAAVTRAGEATFVLDTGNNRILKLDDSGHVSGTIGAALDANVHLQQPMAMASDGQHLYVANSQGAEILVLSTSGAVEQVLPLQTAVGELTPRPIGIAVTAGGGLVVSDANNHRVLFLDSRGRVVTSVGTGARAAGTDGFNVPAGLALDASGNVYVVDTLNGRVVKLSPDGAYLGQFGRLADTAGSIARPKGVAVDAAGRVFVSDGLQAAVEVFAPDGTYLGFIGRSDANDPASGSIFEAPAGLSLTGDRLDVIDAFAGLITLRLSGLPDQPATGNQ
jgi:DNA-binding beta-propeller fold protein YncE